MDPRLKAAIDLFNRGRFLAAHELFDELWEASEDAGAELYKGLVQASVALHHFEEGNLEGAAKLYRGHRRSLAAFLPHRDGIDVERFLIDMQTCFGALNRREQGASFEAAPLPKIAAPKGEAKPGP